MAKRVAHPERSAGARLERAVTLRQLRAVRRVWAPQPGQAAEGEAKTVLGVIDRLIDFEVRRQSRYDKRVGGLGKK